MEEKGKKPKQEQCARCGERLFGYILRIKDTPYCTKCYKEKRCT